MSSVDRTTSRASIAALLIVVVAVATRIVSWWNPVAHVDDQFYLLGGQELLRGHWPYIDVWDRKPVGLFLIYAGIAAIGGGSVLVVNLTATAFAAGTAWLLRKIALRFAGPSAALMGALTYLIVLPIYGGQNGQSPVFYNLLIAAAFLLLLRSSEAASRLPILRRSLGAMLLCGLAMTVKQTSFVEGGFIGLALLWLLRKQGATLGLVAGWGFIMAALALAPTILAYLAFYVRGGGAANDYLYANYLSIFDRGSFPGDARMAGIQLLLLYLFPLFILAALGLRTLWRERRSDVSTLLIAGWLAAAVGGYLIVPSFFDHYALPLLQPLCVLAAVAFGRYGLKWFFAYAAFCLIQGAAFASTRHQVDAFTYEKIRHTVEQAAHGQCLYVFDGPSRLYVDFPKCRPTRYLFPDHLSVVTERGAVGTDTLAEVRRILDTHPAVIVTRKVRKGRHSPEVEVLVKARLSSDYRAVLATTGSNASIDGAEVWQRRDLEAPQLTMNLP